jgi:hypothetical protein
MSNDLTNADRINIISILHEKQTTMLTTSYDEIDWDFFFYISELMKKVNQ